MEEIAALFAAVIGGFVHICISLVGAFFGSGVMASRTKGRARLGYSLMLLACGYFLFGILRFFVEALATPGFYGLYTMPVFLGMCALFFVGAILAGSAQTADHPNRDPGSFTSAVEEASIAPLIAFGIFLLFGIIAAISSASTTTQHQQTLRDRACAEYEERVPEGLRETASAARDLAERFLDRAIAPSISCSDEGTP